MSAAKSKKELPPRLEWIVERAKQMRTEDPSLPWKDAMINAGDDATKQFGHSKTHVAWGERLKKQQSGYSPSNVAKQFAEYRSIVAQLRSKFPDRYGSNIKGGFSAAQKRASQIYKGKIPENQW